MRIAMFVLCDAATQSHGKLNLLGSFDHIFAAQIPCVHPSCAIAAIIRFDRMEEGTHKIRVTFGDEDGRLIVPPLDADLHIAFPHESNSAAHNMVLNLQGLKFERYGEHSIDLAIDGRLEASIPLYVCPAPQP